MSFDPFHLSSYSYDLPEELIAQHPASPRDSSRLMVIERTTEKIYEIPFRELMYLVEGGDTFVFNDTKVIPARLFGKKESGGVVEMLLLRQLDNSLWEVMARPGRKLKPNSKVFFEKDFSCEVLETLFGGNKVVRFQHSGDFYQTLRKYGQMPLPHYIHRPSEDCRDHERYQTTYATNPGAVAAPTAGLHFTPDFLNQLEGKGVRKVFLTLHVGLGTFRPVQTHDIRHHQMHAESLIITPEAAEQLNIPREGKREICVGTTCCRALEAATSEKTGKIQAGEYETDIFIYPGYQFKRVNTLLTNFHLPCSTLLMLVCAFGGYELILEAYKKAVKERFRFYSYGDAMLIL